MSYSVQWHPRAYRVFRRLPQRIIERILRKTDEVIKDPFRYLEHFEGMNVYKLRIGDYRLLVDVDQHQQLLLVRHFDKRGRVYE